MSELDTTQDNLLDAARRGDVERIEHLMNNSEVTQNCILDALRLAAKEGHIKCIEHLMTHSKNTSLSISVALNYALLNGRVKCVQFLLTHPKIRRIDIAASFIAVLIILFQKYKLYLLVVVILAICAPYVVEYLTLNEKLAISQLRYYFLSV